MEIRKLTADLKPALDLVWDVFLEYTAPDFSEEGVEAFRRFIDHDGMATAVADGSCDLWAAFLGPAPVGVIAARGNHICLFFVAGPSQKHGVGRRLFETFRAHRLGHVSHTPITVNAAPSAVPAYRRLGFKSTGEEKLVDGIRFVPMERPVEAQLPFRG